MRSNSESEAGENSFISPALDAEDEEQNSNSTGYEGGGRIYSPKDEWLLKYEVNEKGVGRILLPPSLSILLQSDRVSITPSAGGLFIRSV